MGVLYLQDRHHPDQRDQVVRAEDILSPLDVALQVGVLLHPREEPSSYTFVELPGGPASVAVIAGPTVEMTYDPGVTTWGAMAAVVAAFPAASALLELVVMVLAVMPAGLGGTGGDLWSVLAGVPGAVYWMNPANGRWEPWQGQVSGAALAAVLPDNRIASQTINLGVGPRVDVALGLAGRNLNVLGMTGAASIRLVNGGVPYPTLPALAMDIFPLDRFNFDFTDVLLSNIVQPGLSLTLAAMWRV